MINAFFLFQGTKWCGPGGANGYEDLGSLTEVDKCCRAHDHCDHIEKSNEKYGLRNSRSITVLHCRCDKEFRDCLRRIGSGWADTVGRMYFYYQSHCYKSEHPIVACKRYSRSIVVRNRCTSYIFDLNRPVMYQWFDLPFYNEDEDFDAFRDEQYK